MGSRERRLIAAAAALAVAASSRAAEPQECNAAPLAAIDAWLAQHR